MVRGDDSLCIAIGAFTRTSSFAPIFTASKTDLAAGLVIDRYNACDIGANDAESEGLNRCQPL